MSKKVIVVGAGVAGLASAIRLQHAGYQVEIYEKGLTPGGKMNRIELDGYTFDLGPSIVMMPELYREIFELCGRNPDDYIPMEKLNPIYRAYFSDIPDKPFDISSDLTELTQTIESISEEDTEGFFLYLHEIYKRFVIAKHHILQRPFRKNADFYNLPMLKKALKLKAYGTADSFIGKYIKNERLKQLISFQTLYIGISPIESPPFYAMIPMIQFLYGVWFIKGGMYTMALAMERLFTELGGTIHYGKDVQEICIHNRKATGITVDGRKTPADFVVCNADFPYAMKHLIKDKTAKGKYTDKKIDSMKYTCSCFLLYLGMDRKYEEIDHVHNFIFNEKLNKNLEDIFDGKKLTNASFYVYIASKMDPSLAPEGKDGLYILMPVSNVAAANYQWDEETISYYRSYIFDELKKIRGFENIENEIVTETYTTPSDFESRFNAYNGATFGLQPTMAQSNHFRPQSKATHCENLYFTGSSTHPGAGVPIVLLSAKITTQELIQDDTGEMFDYSGK
ncbi:phytoene desaturase [Peribacillus muralis]|uniref:phytoene desaturase family protein n=1 Tax=Peribacillus muralis TaxID=264697 RepID=UPI001F4E2958|nr:phytoene desaturase family protein [Peribacillus muralis]MCK1994039.1 phytoene desaturase family protein [Peribacillus muralis]MCK2014594.1 phytoene desaturase family protein [Peribacillus muralis]